MGRYLCECGCGQPTPLATRTRDGNVKGQPIRFLKGHGNRTSQGITPPNPTGICLCGCGEPAPIAKRTNSAFGHVKGEHVRFIAGHNTKGKLHRDWNGGRRYSRGYCYIFAPLHPRASVRGWVAEHVLVMEAMIGRPLDSGEVVHHRNHVRSDNRPENLELMGVSDHCAMHGREGCRVRWGRSA